MPKKSLEEEINDFLDIWNAKTQISFFEDVIPLLQLYNATEESDWVLDAVGAEDLYAVRLARTAYLVSRLAQFNTGKLAEINAKFRDLWKRIEKDAKK